MSWTLVDTVEVVAASPVQGQILPTDLFFDFSSTGDGSEQYDVDGDTDKAYVIVGDIIARTTTLVAAIQPNGLSSNLQHYLANGDGSSTVADITAASLQCYGQGGSTANSTTALFVATFNAESGKRRSYIAHGAGRTGSGGSGAGRNQIYGGTWNDTATLLSSIRMDSGGFGWAEGSRFSLYVLNRTTIGAGGGSNEMVPPVISNVVPTNGSQLATRFTPVSFEITDPGSGLGLTLITIKYKNNRETQVIYDGTSFLFPFADFSTKTTITDGCSFSLLPSGGWTDDIETLKIHTVDAVGNITP